MKKIIKFSTLILVVIMLILLCSCDRFHNYKGDDYDLFTVATNSMIGTKGAVFMRPDGPTLTVKENDSYGRTLFYYWENSSFSTHSILICQKAEGDYVFYYEDCNFISKGENNFTDEEINKLKEANDWNKELDESKMIKKPIIKNKQKINRKYETSTIEEALERVTYGALDGGYEYGFHEYCYSNENNSKNLFLVCMRASGQQEKNLLVILNNDCSYGNNCVMELKDYKNYQEDLKQFKEINNWY